MTVATLARPMSPTGDTSVDLGAAALEYAARGWPVFPCHTPTTFGPKSGAGRARCSCRADDCERQGKHPRTPNGLDDATTDLERVTGWWRRWPDANIALRTGEVFDVLDLDGPHALDGLDALALAELNLEPDAPVDVPAVLGPMALTGLGVHVYVAPTGHRNREAMGGHRGVDWRGSRGYVIAPPSLHYRAGDRYTWSPNYGPDTPLEPVPAWLEAVVARRRMSPIGDMPAEVPVAPPDALDGPRWPTLGEPGRGSPYGLAGLEGEVAELARAGEGTRHKALYNAALKVGRLVAGGELDGPHAVAALVTTAAGIGLPETEVESTIEDGLAVGMADPRTGGAP